MSFNHVMSLGLFSLFMTQKVIFLGYLIENKNVVLINIH